MRRETGRKSGGAGYASAMSSAAVVCFAVAAVALGRIRLKSEESRAYAEINRLDVMIQDTRRANRKLQVDHEILTSPAGLSGRVREMRLNLVMPGDDARVVLPEPASDGGLPQALALRQNAGRDSLVVHRTRADSGASRAP